MIELFIFSALRPCFWADRFADFSPRAVSTWFAGAGAPYIDNGFVRAL